MQAAAVGAARLAGTALVGGGRAAGRIVPANRRVLRFVCVGTSVVREVVK